MHPVCLLVALAARFDASRASQHAMLHVLQVPYAWLLLTHHVRQVAGPVQRRIWRQRAIRLVGGAVDVRRNCCSEESMWMIVELDRPICSSQAKQVKWPKEHGQQRKIKHRAASL